MSENIDKQIADLQKKKAIIEREKRDKTKEELILFGNSLKNKCFRHFEGASMVGNAHWTVYKVTDFRVTSDYNSYSYIEVYGPSIRINICPAIIIRNTIYDAEWQDPDYRNASGGTNKHKTSIEGKRPSYIIRSSYKKDGRRKTYPHITNLETAYIDDIPASQWNTWAKIQYPSDKEFSKRYKEITEKEWLKYVEITENVQNYIWSNLEDLYHKDYLKVWNDRGILAVTQVQKTKVQEYLNLLHEALDKNGRFNGNIMQEFIEFLKNKKYESN